MNFTAHIIKDAIYYTILPLFYMSYFIIIFIPFCMWLKVII